MATPPELPPRSPATADSEDLSPMPAPIDQTILPPEQTQATGRSSIDAGSQSKMPFGVSLPSNFTPLVGQLNSAATNISASASSAFAQFGKGIAQIRQVAGETIGSAERTELSDEYVQLEVQFDKVRNVYENLTKVATQFIQPSAFTEVKLSVAGAVENVASSVQTNLDKSIVNSLRSIELPKTSSSQTLGVQFTRMGNSIGDHPLSPALIRCGDTQEKLGRSKLQMNAEIYEKFVKPIEYSLDTTFRSALLARRAVQTSRLQLDTCKSRIKSAKPEKQQDIQLELSQAQLQFDAAVDESFRLMKAAINSNEGLSSLADFTQAMLNYYRSGMQLLEELAPEIDAMKAENDKAYQL